MTTSAASSPLFRPPAPEGRTRPLGTLAMVLTLWRNPLEIWSKAHFELPILMGDTILGPRAAISDPAAVRRVMLDNAANYRKDALQLRILRPALGNGLFTSEGEEWRAQRRALAPLFSPRVVADFAPAMHRVARAAVARLDRRPDAAPVDADREMALITLQVLEQTLFSQGLARDPAEFQKAVTSYFNTIGRLDPLDLLGAPKFIPRLGRLRGRAALEFFQKAVDDIVAARRRLTTCSPCCWARSIPRPDAA